MMRSPPASSMATTSPIFPLATASGFTIESVRSISSPEGLQDRRQRPAHLGGRLGHADAGRLHRGDLVLGGALAPADDGAGVAPPLAGRRGQPAHGTRHPRL